MEKGLSTVDSGICVKSGNDDSLLWTCSRAIPGRSIHATIKLFLSGFLRLPSSLQDDLSLNGDKLSPSEEVQADHVASQMPGIPLTECAGEEGVQPTGLDAVQRGREVLHGKQRVCPPQQEDCYIGRHEAIQGSALRNSGDEIPPARLQLCQCPLCFRLI